MKFRVSRRSKYWEEPTFVTLESLDDLRRWVENTGHDVTIVRPCLITNGWFELEIIDNVEVDNESN